MIANEKSVGWFFALWEDSESWGGPHKTREAAILAGQEAYDDEDSFYVCEAFNAPLDFAQYAGLDDIFDTAEEVILDSDRINGEFEEGPFFEVTPDQEKDLITRLKAAVAAWQADHGIEFTCRTFSDMRNMEQIPPRTPEVVQ